MDDLSHPNEEPYEWGDQTLTKETVLNKTERKWHLLVQQVETDMLLDIHVSTDDKKVRRDLTRKVLYAYMDLSPPVSFELGVFGADFGRGIFPTTGLDTFGHPMLRYSHPWEGDSWFDRIVQNPQYRRASTWDTTIQLLVKLWSMGQDLERIDLNHFSAGRGRGTYSAMPKYFAPAQFMDLSIYSEAMAGDEDPVAKANWMMANMCESLIHE